MDARAPDFLIVGAMKAGTTSLAAWLRAHPQVFMTHEKELHFFDLRWDRGIDWYRKQFALAPPGVVAGEATPSYMVHPRFVERLAEVVPGARLLVLLRQPSERAWSQYHHSVARGDEHRSFEEVVDDELGRAVDDWRTAGMCLARGRYVEQLRALTAAFRREQLHVELFDRLVAEPGGLFADVCAFLGIDAAIRPAEVGMTYNPRTSVLGDGGRWRRRRKRATPPAGPRNPPLPPALRERLDAYFRPYNVALAEALGVDLPDGW